MGNRSKYRKLPDLFVTGAEVVFETDEGPVVIWVQALNPFEQQEARNDAQGARARLVMALKEYGSPEYNQAKGSFLQRGREQAIEDLADNKFSQWYLEARTAVEDDPEWAERMVILRNSDNTPAAPITDEEQELLAKINGDYNIAVNDYIKEERAGFIQDMDKLDDEALVEDYLEAWRDSRASTVALVEYNLSEILYGARICEAVPDSEGNFSKQSHDTCFQHRERVFETRAEVRDLPQLMQERLRDGFDAINMSVREAKNSDRQGSSSDSSPLPSKEEESTPSTPSETSPDAPGT